jgi:hypothetical protein
MDEITHSRIRHIFRSPRLSFALMTAAELLGMTLKELKREVEDGAIVAVSTGLGRGVTREEMIAAATRTWEQGVIEEAQRGRQRRVRRGARDHGTQDRPESSLLSGDDHPRAADEPNRSSQPPEMRT